jgi:hypothetical protein
MALAILRAGEWYLSATCQVSRCKMILFPDLNDGRVEIEAECAVTLRALCTEASLPIQHFRHTEPTDPYLERLLFT